MQGESTPKKGPELLGLSREGGEDNLTFKAVAGRKVVLPQSWKEVTMSLVQSPGPCAGEAVSGHIVQWPWRHVKFCHKKPGLLVSLSELENLLFFMGLFY